MTSPFVVPTRTRAVRRLPLCLLTGLVLTACTDPETSSGSTANAADRKGSAAPEPATPERPDVAQPAEATPDAAPARWHYTIKPSADLRTMATRVCFDGRLPERFDAQLPASRRSLVSAHRHPGGEPLTQSVGGLDISSLKPGDCIDYVLDIDRMESELENQRRMRRVGEEWYISPDYWLWKPIGGREEALLTATIEAPPGVSLSVPWPYHRRGEGSGDDVYRIPETTFKWLIPGALGHFPIDIIDVGGARLRVAIVGARKRAKRKRLLAWITDAASAVALLGGRMPVDTAQIIVLPTPGTRIGFGFATHGGGFTVVIFVGDQITEANLRKDWVAVHEMLHLGMPMLDDESRWLSEGLATYLEPYLRARAGSLPVTEVWEEMHAGFARGRKQVSERTLRADCVEMRENHAYMRVYWSGAAIALIADVTARQNGSSLDREVLALGACCLHAGEILSADDLLARVGEDGALLAPHLAAAARPHLDSPRFPDVTAMYRALGLSFDAEGRVTLSSDPVQKALREQLTGPENRE